MSNSTATGAGPDSAPASTLGDEIGQLLGDFGAGDESGESPTTEQPDAAGASPAERPAQPDDPPAAPEGVETTERADAPSADADALAPDAPSPDEDDPLAAATPFTYTVNGESRPFDGIKVLGAAGAVVTPEALTLLERRLGERDSLFEQNRAQFEKTAELERLSEWHTTDERGNPQVLQGREALEALRVTTGILAASLDTLKSIFADPATAAQYVTVDPQTGGIVWDSRALAQLAKDAENQEFRTSVAIRQHMASVTSPRQSAASRQTGQAPTVDFAAAAPSVIQQAAGAQAATLTEKDTAFLASVMPKYVRPVTADEARANPMLRVGSPIVDAEFTQVVQERAALRAEVAKTVTATSAAANENARKLAAAALGKPAQRPAAPPSTRPPTPAASQDDAWDLMERSYAVR